MDITAITNDITGPNRSRAPRIEYVFCGGCGNAHYTTHEAYNCGCGAEDARDKDGNKLRRPMVPHRA